MVSRGSDRWRQLSDLCRESSASDASSWRHRSHGQSRQPQRQNRASAHPFCRRQALLPAQILARPEPHRAGLRQAQALPAKTCRPNGRNCLPRHRRSSPALQARRMRKLLGKLRIWSNLTSSRFKPRAICFKTSTSSSDARPEVGFAASLGPFERGGEAAEPLPEAISRSACPPSNAESRLLVEANELIIRFEGSSTGLPIVWPNLNLPSDATTYAKALCYLICSVHF